MKCGPVPAASACSEGHGQRWRKARNPHPLPSKHTGGEGLRDHCIPTPSHS